MANGEYGKYFMTDVITPDRFGDRLTFRSREHEVVGEKNFTLLWYRFTEPILLASEPHAHDFDQFLHFYGADSSNNRDFDAEVEISLGEESEKHIITEPTVLHIPKHTIHCPINFKIVKKPLIFMNVALTPYYDPTASIQH